MNPTEYPGALFVDSWPDREQVLLYPNARMETHLGRIEFPPGERHGPLFLDSTLVGGFAFVGLAHDTTGLMLEWHAAHGWVPGPPFVSGRGVFDQGGVWRDALPAGYQYVNDANVPVSRVETYGPTHGLSEWVEVDGLLIGQGHDSLFPAGRGGMHVWDGTHHRQLDDGVCFFVKRRRIGNRVAVSWIKSGMGAKVWRGTLAELRALPLSVVNVVPPIVNIPPDPEPEPMPLQARDEFDTVQHLAKVFPELLRDENLYGDFLNLVIRNLGGHPWGRKLKNDGQTLNTDVLAYDRTDHQIEYYDVIVGDGSGNVAWGPTGPFKSGENGTWVAVTDVDDGPGPEPKPTDDVIAKLEARIAALEGPQRYAIKSPNGNYLRHDWSDNVAKFDRKTVGDGEIVTLERAP